MKKYTKITFIVLRLFLGGVMISAGAGKFFKPISNVTEVVKKINNENISSNTMTLQKVLYIGGLKQTGYFWEVVAFCELLFGIFLIFYRSYFLGSLFLLPITLHIFLFHLFLEPDEVGELVYCGLLFAVNVALMFMEKNRWKGLFKKPESLKNIISEVTGS
tara:strand:+ start:1096 stop:1578 length:483 start_codon:yes stop_codon:yes gene_type:complete